MFVPQKVPLLKNFDDIIACDLWFGPPYQSKVLATPINGKSSEKNFEDLFFWRTLAAVSLFLGPWPRAFLSLASRGSVLEKAVLGLGLGFFLCPWPCPWSRALYPRLHLCSVHLFNIVLGSAVRMEYFSAKHSWHVCLLAGMALRGKQCSTRWWVHSRRLCKTIRTWKAWWRCFFGGA